MRAILQRNAIIPIMLLALAARVAGISSRPLWYDEAFSVLFAEKGPAAMLFGTLSSATASAAEEHPLAYYTLLWAWMRAFGESPIAVRALSIIPGLIVVLVVYVLARRLFGSTAAAVAGTIAAISPFQVHFSQEVRMYILMSLWLMLATYAYWRATETSGWSWWAVFAVCAALAQYSHNLAAFYLVPLAAWPLLTRNWRAAGRVLVAGCAALLLYAPWLIHVPAQIAKIDQNYWIARPPAYRLLSLLLYFVTNLPLPGWWLMAGLFLALLIVSLGIWVTIRAVRSKQAGADRAVWLLYLAFVPALLLFAFSQWIPVYVERALLPSGTIFCIWLAWVFTEIQPARLARPLLGSLILCASAMGIYQHVTYAGVPYAAMMQSIQAREQSGDAIIHSNKLSMLPAVYYARGMEQEYVADPPNSTGDTLAPSTQKVLGLLSKPDIETAAGHAERIWFIIFDESNQEYVNAGFPAHPQLMWLMQQYVLMDKQRWGDVYLYLFSRAP